MKKLLLVVSVMTALSSCQSDESPAGNDDVAMNAIEFSLPQGLVRSFGDNSETVWVWAGESSADDFIKAWKLTPDGSEGLTGTPRYYWLASVEALKFRALHGNFADDEITAGTTSWDGLSLTHTVEQDQTTDAAIQKSELLYACKDDATNGVDVDLQFKHLMTKITVVIDCANSSGLEKLTEATIVIPGVKTTATFSSATSKATANDGTTKDIKIAAIESALTESSTFECSAVIPEQTVASGSELLKLTLANGQEIKYKKANNDTFLAGNEYKITLTVNAAAATLSVSGFEVVDGNTRETTDWNYRVPIN